VLYYNHRRKETTPHNERFSLAESVRKKNRRCRNDDKPTEAPFNNTTSEPTEANKEAGDNNPHTEQNGVTNEPTRKTK